MRGRSVKERLLLFLSATLALAVTPFASVRLRDGQWAAATLDISLVCLMLLLFLYVYITRKTQTPGVMIVLIFIIGALTSVYLLGINQIYWAFPALTAAFFMLECRQALALCLTSFCAIAAIVWDAHSPIVVASIFLTLLTSILFAYSFALTSQYQQSALQHLASVDPLTGAGNRRAQNEKLDAVNAIFRRANIPVSVLILDIDFFKQINDSHGHPVGDQILLEVADLIRGHTRPTENLYRYGGEEFVVVAEYTGLDIAAQLAEKLRRLIEQKTFHDGIRLTISIGVAQLCRGEGRQGWISRADGALFRAKKEGRNRVVLEMSSGGGPLTPGAGNSSGDRSPGTLFQFMGKQPNINSLPMVVLRN